MGPRSDVLDGGAHWRHLANTVDQSVQWRHYGLSLTLQQQLVNVRYDTIRDAILTLAKPT